MILALRITTSACGFQVASIAARLISSVGAAEGGETFDLSDCEVSDFKSASEDGCCANVSVASSAKTATHALRMCISGLLQKSDMRQCCGIVNEVSVEHRGMGARSMWLTEC